MTPQKIINRLEKVESIIENQGYSGYHSPEYMDKIFSEENKLRKALYWECAIG